MSILLKHKTGTDVGILIFKEYGFQELLWMKLLQIEAVSVGGAVLGLLIFIYERNVICGTSTRPVSESIVMACAITMRNDYFLEIVGFLLVIASLGVLVFAPVYSHVNRRANQQTSTTTDSPE